MNDKEHEEALPEVELDFSKQMAEILRLEQAKKNTMIPGITPGANKEPENINREYQKRYSHRANDRFWIGPRRY